MNKLYDHITFSDVWESSVAFVGDYMSCPLRVPSMQITEASATTLFYLLYSKYGNNSIANLDVYQFKAKVWATIAQYGPTWEKQLEMQQTLRHMTDDELMLGSKIIYNHAYNDGSEPSTDSLEETPYINEQNTTNNKKNKLQAYNELMTLLQTDVTEYFLNKFKKLFKTIIVPTHVMYCSDEGDEE